MIISMIIGMASMTSAVPIGAAVRSSGAPWTASRSRRQASPTRARGAAWVSIITGEDIASLILASTRTTILGSSDRQPARGFFGARPDP
jgi:hypothetical protein